MPVLKPKYYYKVVYDSPVLGTVSAVVGGNAQVCYRLNRYAHPNPQLLNAGYGLFVFSTLTDAVGFRADRTVPDPYSVYRTKIGKTMPLPPPIDPFYLHDLNIVPEGSPSFYPRGTVMTDKVMLLRRVR